jgi:TIR domain-containing protein/zinc ribbon protein
VRVSGLEEKFMLCSKCRYQNSDSAAYCVHCGAALQGCGQSSQIPPRYPSPAPSFQPSAIPQYTQYPRQELRGNPPAKSPVVAVLLSFIPFFPAVGQIYNREFKKAGVIWLVYIFLWGIGDNGGEAGAAFAILCMFGGWIWMATDAYMVAKRNGGGPVVSVRNVPAVQPAPVQQAYVPSAPPPSFVPSRTPTPAIPPNFKSAFVSYSRSDSEFALRLATDLKAAGASVWLDQLDIPPGAPWDLTVQEALTKCPAFLVILSPFSVRSDNVSDEVAFALDKKKKVLPILYRDCEIPFRLTRIQYIDFRAEYTRSVRMLVSALASGSR